MPLRFIVETKHAEDLVNRIVAALDLSQIDKVVHNVALQVQADVKAHTPNASTSKMATGNTMNAWQLLKLGPGVRKVENTYDGGGKGAPIMVFLEEGTKAHGPLTAKALFIPLKRQVAVTGYRPGMKYGVDFILRKWVKGIQAMHIARNASERAKPILLSAFRDHLAKAAKV